MRILRVSIFSCLVLAGMCALFGPAAQGSLIGSAVVRGRLLETGTGLPLVGVTIVTDGPTSAKALSDGNGNFVLEHLLAGRYQLIASLAGCETTVSDAFMLSDGQQQNATLAIARAQGLTSGIRTLGRTTIRASASLQTAAVVSQTLTAQSLQRRGVYRVADALRQLPSVNTAGGETAAPGDDVHLDIRGIGQLETTTLLDGHPLGPGFNGSYNFELSPVFGLRDVKVIYGSGSDLYGVDAIGGVVDMQTLDPTITSAVTFTQGYGTWSKLTSALQATGSTATRKVGYALAYGTQGLDGPFHHDRFYQASAAFDPYATDPAVRALAVYEDDTSIANRSGLIKLRYNFSDNAHLTATFLGSFYWDNKTGNGDNDYLPFEVALANGRGQLANAIAAGGDTCNATNPRQFTVGSNANGSTPGIGPGGKPDGGSPCQSPESFAAANFGYQGAGPAWQAFQSNDYHLRYDTTHKNNTFAVDAFTNLYAHTYDRTSQLPFRAVPNDAAFWYNEQSINVGGTASDDIVGDNNEFGLGYFWENSAYRYLVGNASTGGVAQPAPITHDTAFFLRDAFHPLSSHLTTYGNVWFKHSTITNTSFVDPRIAFVYSQGNNVLRLAGGRTSTQPFPNQINSPFVPVAVGSLIGNINCSSLNSVGNVPSSQLRPERATDEELSFGHRFEGDSSVQLTLYDENVFDKIYDRLTLPLSALSVPFNPTAYANAVATTCGVSASGALSLLGVNGTINIGHALARGIEISGRQRITSKFFADYTYGTESSALMSSDPALIDPAFGGDLKLIPKAQLPNVPLHKYSLALDYTFGKIETRLGTYHVSENNPKNLPAYTFSDLQLAAPVGIGNLTATVNNLFNTYADYRGLIGEGYPLALNNHAQRSDYQPFFGAQTTERFGLPFRSVECNYSVKLR